jgi:hypothetical protein
MYRQITTDANGVVTGAKLYLKTGTGATAASWSALDMTAIVVV